MQEERTEVRIDWEQATGRLAVDFFSHSQHLSREFLLVTKTSNMLDSRVREGKIDGSVTKGQLTPISHNEWKVVTIRKGPDIHKDEAFLSADQFPEICVAPNVDYRTTIRV